MENKYGYTLPKPMLAEFSSLITDMSDEKKTVLTNHEIHQAFKDTYVNVAEPIKTRSIVQRRKMTVQFFRLLSKRTEKLPLSRARVTVLWTHFATV